MQNSTLINFIILVFCVSLTIYVHLNGKIAARIAAAAHLKVNPAFMDFTDGPEGEILLDSAAVIE